VSNGTIRDIRQHLKSNLGSKIVVEGYSSSDGDQATNDRLSKRRADAVKRYLVKRGISSGKIESVGKGTENPVADNSTAKGRKKNRRAEIVLQ